MAEVLFQQGAWAIYADATTHKPYFYNEETNQTTWDMPSELKDIEEVKKLLEASEPEEGEVSADGHELSSAVAVDEDGVEGEAVGWRSAVTADGQVYYYDGLGNTQWDRPDELEGDDAEEGQAAPEHEAGEEGDARASSDEDLASLPQRLSKRARQHDADDDDMDMHRHRQDAMDGMESQDGEMDDEDDDDKSEEGGQLEEEEEEERQYLGFTSDANEWHTEAQVEDVSGPRELFGAAAEADLVTSPRQGLEADRQSAASLDGERMEEDGASPGHPRDGSVGAGKLEDTTNASEGAKADRPKAPKDAPDVPASGDRAQAEEKGAEDRKAAKLERATRALQADDAIMDTRCKEWATTYLKGDGSGDDDTRDLRLRDMLSTGYHGYANMALLLATWLQDLQGDGTDTDLDAHDLVLNNLGTQVKKHFKVGTADDLLMKRNRQEMAFIDDMMEHQRWRRLLMEIFSEHKDSKLLGGYCMHKMSMAGHNTEMANIISVTDYWTVARGVLSELLAEVPRAEHTNLWGLLSTLQRICCATAYLHALSQEVLWLLEARLLQESSALQAAHPQDSAEGRRAMNLINAARKYKRIREELVKASWEEASEADRVRSRFVHKLSAWHKHQGTGQGGPEEKEEEEEKEASGGEGQGRLEGFQRLRGVLLQAFSERSLSAPRMLDTLLHFYVQDSMFEHQGSSDGLGLDDDDDDDDKHTIPTIKAPLEVLRHPQVLELLVKAIFDPTHRLSTSDQRSIACKVLSVASCALPDGTVDKSDSSALYRKLCGASDVLAGDDILRWNLANTSIPSQLKGYLREPVIAMGFLLWLRATIKNPGFHDSRSFNHVMQVFMRLLQYVIESSALHRPPVFAVLKSLLVLKPTDGAHSILDMKKNAIECCVFLMAQGLVMPVLDYIQSLIQDMDHALIRHFFGLALSVCKPPYSPTFAQGVAKLLREVPVGKALRSSYLEGTHRQSIAYFVEECCTQEATLVDDVMKRGLELIYHSYFKNSHAS